MVTGGRGGPRRPPGAGAGRPVRWWRPLAGFVLVATLVLAGVAVAASVVVHRAAERAAVEDAVRTTDLLAGTVVEPALRDGVVDGDAEALAVLDAAVRRGLPGGALVRAKLWDPDGRIVYSDEPRLIGQRFALDAGEAGALRTLRASAEVSDLSRPENSFERDAAGAGGGGELLEVYRPVRTPEGRVLLFETYTRYDAVDLRTAHLWSSFVMIVVLSLLVLAVAQAPLVWLLLRRVRRTQREREAVLTEAVAASDAERRRIAATLHDGAVQELAASAYLVAGAADRARARGDRRAADQLETAAGSVRTSIGGLRSLLVDIYPPALRGAGLNAALADLGAPLRARGITVDLDLSDTVALPADIEDVVFRVARELVRNSTRHADASAVRIAFGGADGGGDPGSGPGAVVLEIADDGVGLDPDAVGDPPEGHLGIRLVTDLAVAAGARLLVRSVAGRGTTWRMEVPV